MTHPKEIGKLNGFWSYGFRAMIVVFSLCFVPWVVWMTHGQILDSDFRERGDRWTQQQGEESRRRIETLEEIAGSMDGNLHDISERLARIEALLEK